MEDVGQTEDRESRENHRRRESRVIDLDFGGVPVDVAVLKAVKIRNDDCTDESYEIRRDPTTNPLDIAFHLEKNSCTADAVFRIRYQPILPSCRSVDYFVVGNCGTDDVTRIVARGRSIGPNATIDADKITMVCALGESCRKRVTIANDSQVEANFVFDVDDRQNSFQPEPAIGTVAPRSRIQVLVTFRPTFEGPHLLNMPCLILHQAPLMILMRGYCGKSRSSDKIPTLVYPAMDADGFRIYMSDSDLALGGRNLSAQDLIFLSNRNLHFGRTAPRSRDSGLRSPLTTCFTNNSQTDMLVKWHRDVEGNFSLKPNKARVNAGETCLFEVRFDPEDENEFYSREIEAIVYWMKNAEPISSHAIITSIRLMGHTFPPCSSSWIPQYDVPKVVVMPPCLPSSSAYTTFVIRRFGHMPLMFRFAPPEETRFSVKPMQGIIYKNYQVIVVEMSPVGHDKLMYERWSVMFNGNPEYEATVDLRGYSEYPSLSFSSEIVDFSPTHPGCEQLRRVTVRNPTRHRVTYRFECSLSALIIEPARGHIDSNEIVIHNWIFCPPREDDYDFHVDCFATATDGRGNYETAECRLRVVGKCRTGYLTAKLNELDFGERPCGEVATLSFQLFNPGPVEIPYQFILKRPSWPYEEKCLEEVKINPGSGILCSEESETIEVLVTPCETGLHEAKIEYVIRRNSQMEEISTAVEPVAICRIKYFGVAPVIRVEDLLQYRASPEISKYVLWRLLNIKKLNKILSDLQPGETADVEMTLPPSILREEKTIVKFLISNRTSVDATWSFRRIKMCSCSKVREKRGLSLNNFKYDCLHRNLCTIFPRSGSLKAREKTTVTIELRYALLGETKLQWILDVGHERHVRISMKMTGLTELEKSAVLLYGSRVDLKQIYIGDRDPINQICWIYNPTSSSVAYSVDTRAFRKFNENHRCEIFSCLNPSGVVRGFSHEPILINFRPRSWGVLEVELPVTLGSDETTISIRAESADHPFVKMSQEISPIRDILRMPELPIYFNTDHVTLPPTPTHSRVTRLIMVHNRSEIEVIAYKWKRYDLPGIIELDVEPKTARIQPGKLQTHRLTIVTGGKPCRINADVTCEFINQSQKRAYEKSVLLRNALREEAKDHFTITEKGTAVPIPEATVLEAPKPFYKSLTVRCYIYSPLDEGLKTRPKERLKNCPPLEISLERKSTRIPATRESIELSKFLLEGMIWEILQSTNFRELPNNDIKYSQVVATPLQRRRIRERSYVKPSGRTIERVLENMIFMIVHKEFALDVIHLTQTSDARQVAYQKMWQQVPHRGDLE